MKTKSFILAAILLSLFLGSCSKKDPMDLPKSPNAVMKEINWTDVTWTKGFWADKFELNKKETIPAVYRGFMSPENTEHLNNLKIAAGLMEGEFKSLDWSDGDNYKWIESMALVYAVTKDPELDKTMDEWIDVISKAQLPDGYISTNMQIKKIERYSKYPERHNGAYHEMYNMGHLLTAACIHYRATGKDNFLKIAVKVADHLVNTFKPGAPEIKMLVGNLPNVMGLVDMYRITGDKRYLESAQVSIDIRGHMADTTDFTQDFIPFRDEDQAVGHSVFATYLYAGAADIYAETGEKALMDALNRIWENATFRRSYITGGVAAFANGLSARGSRVGEGFGADYQLPNRTAYNETCANIGSAMWNFRMALLTGDARFTDRVENVLYNSMLAALSADGQTFFYANPLECNFDRKGQNWHHTDTRWGVHSCYCCPPQVTRAIAGLGRWAYSVSDDKVWVHIYGGNKLDTKLDNGPSVALTQESDYPWDGTVKITIDKAPSKEMSVMLRIPGWVEGASLKINQEAFEQQLAPGTYLELKRKWKKGDVLDLNFPMPVQLMEANPLVADSRNKLAVMRGPVVYAAEFPVSENGEQIYKEGVFIAENATFTPETYDKLFGGVVVLKGKAMNTAQRDLYLKTLVPDQSLIDTTGWSRELYKKYSPIGNLPADPASMDITLIPYYSWANRGPAYMSVWIPLASNRNYAVNNSGKVEGADAPSLINE